MHIGSKIVQAERYFNSSLSCWVLSENNSIAVEDYGKNAPVIKHPFEKKLTSMGFEPTTILLTVIIRQTELHTELFNHSRKSVGREC